jgi:hypothetical protein
MGREPRASREVGRRVDAPWSLATSKLGSKCALVRRHLGFLAYPLLLSCNSAASGTIQIITGEETDTFTQTPVPTQIVVQAEDSTTYDKTTLATAPYPTSTIDLGNQDQGAVASILVIGADASNNELVYGATIPLQYGALDGETLPVFVQRVGQNARLPNPPADTRQAPTLAVLSDRFLIIGGGSDASTSLTTQVYDFAQFSLLDPAPTLPTVPASMPIVGTVGLLLDAAGDASYYDFSADSAETGVPSPTDTTNGFTFADVAGGQTIYDQTDGYVFVVGATRTTGAATAAVLMINPNDTSNADYPTGNLTWLSLTAPRSGASAAWVAARGLVVAGGNADPTVAGVELIAVSSPTAGTALPFPADGSSGSGMTALNEQFVLLAGGVTPSGADAGVREIDLACEPAGDVPCAATPWGPNGGALPALADGTNALTGASAFTFDAAHAFLVGSEPMSSPTPGLTHTFTLTSAGATEVPTKVAHTNAGAILSPMQSSVLIFGGANGEIESFTPAPD